MGYDDVCDGAARRSVLRRRDNDAHGRRGRGSADENFFEYFGLQDQGWETREHRATAALERPAFLDSGLPRGDLEHAGLTARETRRSPRDATESEGSLASESAGEDEEKASPTSSAGAGAAAAPAFAGHSPPVTPFDVEL